MTDYDKAEQDRRRAAIEEAAPKGIEYCARRVIGGNYFMLTPQYADHLRKIADEPQIIDPKFVAAVEILHDVADRIDALDLSLRVRTAAPPSDHRFPNIAKMQDNQEKANTVIEFLDYLQTNGWEVSGAQSVRECVGGFFEVDLDELDREYEMRTTVELRRELADG